MADGYNITYSIIIYNIQLTTIFNWMYCCTCIVESWKLGRWMKINVWNVAFWKAGEPTIHNNSFMSHMHNAYILYNGQQFSGGHWSIEYFSLLVVVVLLCWLVLCVFFSNKVLVASAHIEEEEDFFVWNEMGESRRNPLPTLLLPTILGGR
jgi:hypothetical protein